MSSNKPEDQPPLIEGKGKAQQLARGYAVNFGQNAEYRRDPEMTRAKNQVAPPAKLPLLITESADEFAVLRAKLQQEIEPNGIIEQIYLDDLAVIVWEIKRLRRSKTGSSTTPSAPRCKACSGSCC